MCTLCRFYMTELQVQPVRYVLGWTRRKMQSRSPIGFPDVWGFRESSCACSTYSICYPLCPPPHPATPPQEPICPVCSCGPRSWNHGSQSRIQMSINIISMFGALYLHVFVPWTQQFPLFATIAHSCADSQSCYLSMRDGCKHLCGMWMYFVESVCSCPVITASHVYCWWMSVQSPKLWTDIQMHTWVMIVVLYWNLCMAEKLSTICKNRMLNIIFYHANSHLHVSPSDCFVRSTVLFCDLNERHSLSLSGKENMKWMILVSVPLGLVTSGFCCDFIKIVWLWRKESKEKSIFVGKVAPLCSRVRLLEWIMHTSGFDVPPYSASGNQM